MDVISCSRSSTGTGLLSPEAEIKALYNFVALRVGSDGDSPLGARIGGGSPLVPQKAICAKVARSGKIIVYEQTAKSMDARCGHLWQMLMVVSAMSKPVLVLIVHPRKLILRKLPVPHRWMDAGMTISR